MSDETSIQALATASPMPSANWSRNEGRASSAGVITTWWGLWPPSTTAFHASETITSTTRPITSDRSTDRGSRALRAASRRIAHA